MSELKLIILDGDETGQELLDASLKVLEPSAIGFELELERYDLSLPNRRETNNGVCEEAAAAMREAGYGIKAATITPEGADDVGSPNRLIREGIGGTVIERTGRRIPGTTPVAGIHHPICVCRMAVGDAYGAEQWREETEGGTDEIAYRTEKISRRVCKAVAEHSFRVAEKMEGKVYGGPKWTVSPVYEGMLKEEMDAASERYPDIPYEPVLIDATYAGLVTNPAETALVIPTLNRDGDLLSDLVMPMYGTIAGAESVLLSLDEKLKPVVAMSEAPHGTAPALEGKDIANPMAMVLACAAVLQYAGEGGHGAAGKASRAIYEATFEATGAGVKTPDLGGESATSEVCEEIAGRVSSKLDAWSSLGN